MTEICLFARHAAGASFLGLAVQFADLFFKWLVCTSPPCGVEIVAASKSTYSRASVEQSMLNRGVNLMCELTYFLYPLLVE